MLANWLHERNYNVKVARYTTGLTPGKLLDYTSRALISMLGNPG